MPMPWDSAGGCALSAAVPFAVGPDQLLSASACASYIRVGLREFHRGTLMIHSFVSVVSALLFLAVVGGSAKKTSGPLVPGGTGEPEQKAGSSRDGRVYLRAFDQLWAAMDRDYSYFEHRKID